MLHYWEEIMSHKTAKKTTKRTSRRTRRPHKTKPDGTRLDGTRLSSLPNTGSEPVPPGATIKAANRETTPVGEPLGTTEPYHAAGDPGSPDESYFATD